MECIAGPIGIQSCSAANRKDWAVRLRHDLVDRANVQMRCKTLCRPGPQHDQIRVPPFCNIQDFLCRRSLFHDVGGFAPQSGLLRNQVLELSLLQIHLDCRSDGICNVRDVCFGSIELQG